MEQDDDEMEGWTDDSLWKALEGLGEGEEEEVIGLEEKNSKNPEIYREIINEVLKSSNLFNKKWKRFKDLSNAEGINPYI
jgi:hypothetical protein